MKPITVIGAGVSGLTCAVRLLESGFPVSILTREEIVETTSSVAAALWFPFRAYPLDKVIDWSVASLTRFQTLEREPGSGIVLHTVAELYRGEPPLPGWREKLEGFRVLSHGQVPQSFSGGYEIAVPVIDSSRYLPYLLGRAIELGAEVTRRELSDIPSLRSESDLVVNCSGTGARDLADDPAVVPIRGQVLRVARSAFDRVVVDEGSAEAAYIVPRTDDCILGTTIEEGVWDRSPSERSTRDIVTRCAELDPRVLEAEILEARVGLRPGRHEVRIEAVELDGLTVLHNYGHGGSGFTLSWGCAEDVLRLVVESLGR